MLVVARTGRGRARLPTSRAVRVSSARATKTASGLLKEGKMTGAEEIVTTDPKREGSEPAGPARAPGPRRLLCNVSANAAKAAADFKHRQKQVKAEEKRLARYKAELEKCRPEYKRLSKLDDDLCNKNGDDAFVAAWLDLCNNHDRAQIQTAESEEPVKSEADIKVESEEPVKVEDFIKVESEG
jgi:hypothetical protein